MAVVGELMSDKRKKSRTPSFLGGTISYNRDLWTADCVVKNISEEGAKLTGRNLPVLPDRFDLSIPQRKTKYRVHVRWRAKDAVGVAFEFAYPADGTDAKAAGLGNRSTRVLRAAVFGDDVDLAGAETKYSL